MIQAGRPPIHNIHKNPAPGSATGSTGAQIVNLIDNAPLWAQIKKEESAFSQRLISYHFLRSKHIKHRGRIIRSSRERIETAYQKRDSLKRKVSPRERSELLELLTAGKRRRAK